MNQPSVPVATDLGPLLHSTRFNPTAHYITAALMFFPLPILATILVFHGPPPKNPSKGFDAFTIGIAVFFGLLGAIPFIVKGKRRAGLVVEAYERGMRFTYRSGKTAQFAYSEVKKLRQTTLRGALAQLTFVLVDGQTHTAYVRGSRDREMLRDVLARFGPIA